MEAVVPTEGVSAPVAPVSQPAAPSNEPPQATGNEAEKPAAAQPGDTHPEEPRGVAKRLKELTEARRAAEAREERLLRLLEQQRAQPPVEQPKAEQPKSLKDFGYDEKAYQDHLYTEARKHAEKAAEEAGKRWKAEQEAVQRRAKFDERVAQFAKTVEDYSEVVTDATPVSEGMADFLLDSEEAGALMYYLGNNPDVATKLYHLSPAKAGRELTKLEDRLIAERKKAAEKPVSQAPPPAPKIEASTPSKPVKSTDPDAEKLPGDEWRRLREKELAARKRK